MVSKKKIPELRFKGFSDDWEQRKLKDLVSPVVREVPKPNIPYNRLSVRSHAKGTFHQKVEDPKTVAMDKLYVVKKNDLIVNITFAWEHAIAVAKKDDDGLLVSHRFPTFLIDKSDVNFIHYVVSQESFRRKMDLISPGGAGRNRVLNKKDFINLTIVVPKTIEEQERIGNFLKKLDNTLALLQDKLIQYQKLKKAFLQFMFPQNWESVPQVRFAKFSTRWEQRKLGEVAEFNPKSILPEQFEYVDLESVVGTSLISHRTEYREKAPSRAQRLAKQGDIFYQMVRPYQKNNFLFGLPYDNFVFSTGYAQLRPNVDSYFLLCRLQEERFVSNVLDRSTGTSYPAINLKDLAQIEIDIPTFREEQIKIGNFCRKLDSIITLNQSKLDQLKKLKSFLLQKMFV